MTVPTDDPDILPVIALSQPIETAACAPDDMARALARGICRMLDEAGQTCLYEFTLRNGRRADVIAMRVATAANVAAVPWYSRANTRRPSSRRVLPGGSAAVIS